MLRGLDTFRSSMSDFTSTFTDDLLPDTSDTRPEKIFTAPTGRSSASEPTASVADRKSTPETLMESDVWYRACIIRLRISLTVLPSGIVCLNEIRSFSVFLAPLTASSTSSRNSRRNYPYRLQTTQPRYAGRVLPRLTLRFQAQYHMTKQTH